VYGKVDFYRGNTMTHPDFDFLDANGDTLNTGAVIPVYPLTQELRKCGFSSRSFRKLFGAVLEELDPGIPDCVPEPLRRCNGLCVLHRAFRQIHFPESPEMLDEALYRFKFQEFLMLQTLMALKRKQMRKTPNTAKCSVAGGVLHKLYHQLPFEPTEAQKRVLKEIYADLRGGVPMNRLLQGDVGCGKTLVAAMAAAIMTANGFQTAIMAPTEILANQHYEQFKKEFDRLHVPCALMTGKTRKAERDRMRGAVASGDIPIVIGTHALIQGDVEFSRLGLTVIDEQHRFGVDQRAGLIRKGLHPHVLAMSATPIPRTLSMTLYGDMDVSVIDEMPKNRASVTTKVIRPPRLSRVYAFLEKEMRAGKQVYVVYPLIAESEASDLQALEKGFGELRERFGDFRLEMLHGRTSRDEKRRIMGDFGKKAVHMLVSTTVIEVGVDNPNATVILIENAERFGLSQLHQLRGRVGRGSKHSWCILVQRSESDKAEERLRIMEKTADGFRIAEEDLRQRGQGDLFGARQHGLPDLRFVDLRRDRPLLEKARKAAFSLIREDPQLLGAAQKEFRRYFLQYYGEKLRYIQVG
jgi:ATP-dependent DNA helicase RecG